MIDLGRFITREIRIFLLCTVGVAVLSALGVVVVHFARGGGRQQAEPMIPVLGTGEEPGPRAPYGLEIPDEIERFLTPEIRFYREPRERWSREEVDRFWMDPKEMGIDALAKQNRKKARELLDSVP